MIDRDTLTKAFPPQAIRQREVVKGGKKLDYVEGHTVIHRLNDSCDEWDFAIKDIHTSVIGTDKEGDEILLVRAHVALTLHGLGTREHIGVQAVRARAGEDLIKGAVTDALKKAATLFGVGLELYGPDYEAGELPTVALNHTTPPKVERGRPEPARQAGRQQPPAEPDGLTSWTDAWKVLRAKEIGNAEDFAVLTGRAIDGLTPQIAVDLVLSCLADIDAAGAGTR